MSHFARALAAIILLGTGFTLSELRPIMNTASVPASVQRSPTPAAVFDFYAGMNQFLAGGSAELLLRSLHPRFTVDGNTQPSRSLLSELAMLRSVHSDLQLTFETLSVSGDLVTTLVSTNAPSEGRFAGRPVVFGGGDPMVDRLTMLDGRILEKRPGATTPIRLANTVEVSRPFDIRSDAVLALERRTFPRGAELNVPVNRGTIVLVESGELHVNIAPGAVSASVARGAATGAIASQLGFGVQNLRLVAGDLTTIPARLPFSLVNTGTSPASALWIELRIPATQSLAGRSGFEMGPSDLPLGITSRTLVSAGAVPPGREISTLTVALAILEPGSELPSSQESGPGLAVVSAGEVRTSTPEGITRTVDGRMVTFSGDANLAAGQAIGLPGGADSGYRSVGSESAVVWIVATSTRLI